MQVFILHRARGGCTNAFRRMHTEQEGDKRSFSILFVSFRSLFFIRAAEKNQDSIKNERMFLFEAVFRLRFLVPDSGCDGAAASLQLRTLRREGRILQDRHTGRGCSGWTFLTCHFCDFSVRLNERVQTFKRAFFLPSAAAGKPAKTRQM